MTIWGWRRVYAFVHTMHAYYYIFKTIHTSMMYCNLNMNYYFGVADKLSINLSTKKDLVTG